MAIGFKPTRTEADEARKAVGLDDVGFPIMGEPYEPLIGRKISVEVNNGGNYSRVGVYMGKAESGDLVLCPFVDSMTYETDLCPQKKQLFSY